MTIPSSPIEPPTDSVLPDPGPPTYTGAAVDGEHWSLTADEPSSESPEERAERWIRDLRWGTPEQLAARGIEPSSISDEVYDESRYTAETRRIMDEHDQRRAADDRECVCGDLATVPVRVEWVDGAGRYWYCPGCATDVVTFIEGAEIDVR